MSNGANLHTRATMFALAKAVIVEAPDGGQFRTFVAHAHNKPVGRIVSRKSRLAFNWEGFGERHMAMISDAHDRVERYVLQPHRLDVMLGDRPEPVSYFPDMKREMADGAIEIIEIKKTSKEISADPDYARKIAKARSVYAAKGWTFRIVTEEDDINRDPLLPNAQMIYADAFTKIGSRERLALVETFDAVESVAYAKAIEIIAKVGGYDELRAKCVLHALVSTRWAGLDLTSKITADTAVFRPETRGRR
ncbi:MAG: hypothetical protein JWL86_5344 [Rhizobium sp.]|nr:hypothetical protein [Rhizobium sp.]